ncbi:MAG: exopolyphosphatase [Crocinitomicaceae bacterium]|nr:exopolyphosphatase [Crocinitomicaceae bacterium]
MKFGAIDVGTNAARLLIGEVIKDGGNKFINKVSYTRIPLRLGESVFVDGLINPKKAEQFIKTIHAFQLISELFEVKELRACATSAMRNASNSNDIKNLILNNTGIEIETISGDEEARLISGTFKLMKLEKSNPYIIVDVGGGSTEISVFIEGKKKIASSFEIGTIRMLFGLVNPTIWEDIYKWLDKNVIPIKSNITFYATGGNINKAHKIIGAFNNEPIGYKKLKKLKDNLAVLSIHQRMDQYQLKSDRADVLVPALEIYCNIMKHLNCDKICVPKIGLSDGIIYDLHKKHNSKR